MTATPMHSSVPLTQLRAAVAGPVITPDADDYDTARRLFYGTFDPRPDAIARPTDSTEVAEVVGLAARTGLGLAVRSGGHGLLGHAGGDRGLVLDLAGMRAIDHDGASRSAWVGAGATTGEYTQAVAAHGLATGFGDTGSVGIGGLTVGGGIGLLVRKYGMTIDHLLAAEIVTADGRIRHVDSTNHPDLFWAIRGGGGNVGVVTRLHFRLHPVDEVVGGFLVLPATPDVIAGFVAAAEAAPDELSTIANVMSAAPPLPFLPSEVHGRRVVLALLVHAGGGTPGEASLAPFRGLAEPIADLTGPMRYAELFPSEEDDLRPRAHVQTLFRDSFDLATARTVLDGLDRCTAAFGSVQLRVLGGTMARVPADATAFAHRERRMMVNVGAMYEQPTEAPVHRAWVERLAGDLADGTTGRYVNFLGTDDEDGAWAAYPPPTWNRLAAIKRRYDPTNLFRHNVNVPPAGPEREVQPRRDSR